MIEISTDIRKAKLILENNELVAIPTETVYGLAGNCLSETAIKKIFETKKRPFFNPLIVHIHSLHKLDEIAQEIPEKAKLLANAFWPGSLTLVLKKRPNVSDLITAGKETVAVRIPNHQLTLELLENLDFPLAAPSANPFGSISPTTAQHVADYFPEELKLVLDGGTCDNGIESTIIGFENDMPVLYRLGSIPVEEIEAVVGKVKVNNKEENKPNAPGMLSRHYAPNTKTILVDNIIEELKNIKNDKIGVITFQDNIQHHSIKAIEILSKEGNIKQATRNLYEFKLTFRKFNQSSIIVFPFGHTCC